MLSAVLVSAPQHFNSFYDRSSATPQQLMQGPVGAGQAGHFGDGGFVTAAELRTFETVYGANELNTSRAAAVTLAAGSYPPHEEARPGAGPRVVSPHPGSRASAASWFIGRQLAGEWFVDRVWIFGGASVPRAHLRAVVPCVLLYVPVLVRCVRVCCCVFSVSTPQQAPKVSRASLCRSRSREGGR